MVEKKELFSTEIYKEAFSFALKAHKTQTTPEGLPYSFHIVSVVLEVINSLLLHKVSYDEANIAICCALLHDVNEDTNTRVTDALHVENIDTVIAGVQALTKDETLPTKEAQMRDSLERLKQQPKCVQMVKLADRITNLAPAPDFWNKAKRQAYVDEAKTIYEALKDSNPYLAKKLQSKIDNYDIDGAYRALNGELIEDNYIVFYGRTGEYNTEKIQLVLDKNHTKYLKTFKALNRLNEYIFKEYELSLFRQRVIDETYTYMPTKDGLENHKKVGVSYIMEVLNTKNLLDLNKQTDDKIEKFITAILDGEECIL